MASPSRTMLPVLLLALSACSGTKSGSSNPTSGAKHSAHGHAVAVVERDEGGSHMLDRVEDEDTRWIELPAFGECPYAPEEVPPFEAPDDAHVADLNPERSRVTNMDAGDETIHNEALLVNLEHATTEVLECVSVSACYDERPLEPGSIALQFEVAPNGDVRGVDVEPTEGLDHTGIRECARLAIWDTKFPPFDGADMVVSYELEID